MRRVFFLSAAAGWAATVGLLARAGLAPALRLVEAFPRGPLARARPLPAEEIIRLADGLLCVKVLGRLLFRTRCLKRSLVLYRLLRAHGHAAEFHVGVRKSGETIHSHAWVTIGGKEIPEAPDDGFLPIYARS